MLSDAPLSREGSLLTEAVCVLSLLKVPAGKGAVVLFTYLLMSSWFIRKGDIQPAFVMEGPV